jgi:uncharacterized protein (UPF0248 family)
MVYNTLNKLKWTGRLRYSELVILHRGAPGNRKLILGKNITEVKKSHFMYLDERGKETYIPMHRVMSVVLGKKILWKRKRH